MKLQRLYSYVRKALDQYHMIEAGDRVALGLSGGKDSLTLLYGLSGLRKFYPLSFELTAITVDLGYEEFNLVPVRKLCEQLEVDYHVVNTRIKSLVKEGECSLCARLRKGAFNEKALELGCSKIAYAHNMDDVVETMMLSLIYEGRFSTFWPVTHFQDTGLTVIRPLILVPQAEVTGFRNKYDLPVVNNPCPYDRRTERTYVRGLLREMNLHAPGAKQRMMTAIRQSGLHGWAASDRQKEYLNISTDREIRND